MKSLVRSWLVGAVVLVSVVIGASRTDAAPVFSFSIENAFGTVSGTVTGTIWGLPDNGSGAATAVLIETFPVGLDSLLPPPIDATLWDQQFENSFTVVNDQIVSGNFYAAQSVNGFDQGFQLFVNGGAGPFNFVNLDGDDTRFVWGDDGFDGAHFALANDVPEPASILLMGAGLVGVARRLRKRVQVQ